MKRPIVITLLVLALLFVLAGIGGVIFFATRGSSFNQFLFERAIVSATSEESKTIKVDTASPVELTMFDDAGDVTIIGADVEIVQVKAVKTAYASTQTHAEEYIKDIKYTVEQNGNNITIKYEIPKSMNFSNKVNTVDFVVTVPTETTVTVDTGYGNVSVTDTKGDADIQSDFGDVDTQNIEGGLSVASNSGTVEAMSIKAGNKNIELKSSFGNITLEKASAADITFQSNSGKVTLKDVNATGDFYSKSDFGDTKYENGSAASINIESNSGKVELSKLKVKELVKVDDDFGDIKLTQVDGASYDLHTNSGTVTVDGAKGSLKAYTDFGNIEITNAEEAVLDLQTKSGSVEFSGSLGDQAHSVRSDFGSITITIPADSKLDVDLKTDFGKVKSDLPITVTLTENSGNESDQITGTINGGGAQLTIKANSGNINIKAIK